MNNIKTKINTLKNAIEYHNKLYYEMATPEITDFEYDSLVNELLKLEKDNPQFKTDDSPTQKVGNDISKKFKVIHHKWPMLSIDNSYTYDELRKFHERVNEATINSSEGIKYCCEMKLDGCALSLQYEYGQLVRAVTRGDGTKGDDVYNNIKELECVPKNIPDNNIPDYIEIRGEITMDKSELDRLNKIREKNDEKLLANPRNAAAGTLKQLDPKEFIKRKVKFTAYEIYPQYLTRTEALENLKMWGFNVNEHTKYFYDIEDVILFCEKWEEPRKKLPYDTDGIVVKVDHIDTCNKMGMTGHAPRFMVAYKFPPEVVETELLEIQVQVGKSGILTPVAHLKPVKLCGTIVKKASLYNFDQLEKNDFRNGDIVKVQKAGEIIPQVIGKVNKPEDQRSKKFEVPKFCPICQHPVKKDDNGGVFIRCINTNCEAQQAGKIIDFLSKECMDVKGFGESIVYQLIDAKLLNNIVDLYHLDYDKMETLEKMGKRRVQILKEAIENSVKQPFERVLMSLNIPNVGKHLSPLLAKKFKNIDALSNATKQDLISIQDIGEVVANDIINWFNNTKNKQIIDGLKKAGLNLKYEEPIIMSNSTHKPLSGKKLLATGKLINYSRQGIDQKIIEMGGVVSSGVTKDTDYLIVGEKSGSKLAKAKALGVATITEEEFESIIQTK